MIKYTRLVRTYKYYGYVKVFSSPLLFSIIIIIIIMLIVVKLLYLSYIQR